MPTNPLLLLFAVALTVVVVKAYGIRDAWKRALVGVTVVVLTPMIL
jgi:hypothetical protein